MVKQNVSRVMESEGNYAYLMESNSIQYQVYYQSLLTY